MNREHDAAAEIIHAAMVWAAQNATGAPQPWQGGNSDAEYEARRAAAKIADLPRTAQQDLDARQRAAERMGWDEVRAFQGAPPQAPSEDAGGYLLRRIKALFGVRADPVESYRSAALRLVTEARAQQAAVSPRTRALQAMVAEDERIEAAHAGWMTSPPVPAAEQNERHEIEQMMQLKLRAERMAGQLNAPELKALLAGTCRQPGVTVSLSTKGLTNHSLAADGLSATLQPTPLGLLVIEYLENTK